MALYTLTNKQGIRVVVSSFGAVIREIHIPDRHGVDRDIVVGYRDEQDYLTNRHHFGSTVGRYANRISEGGFTLDGKRYDLPVNTQYGACLHSGPNCYDTRPFQITWNKPNDIHLELESPDGDQGFPGRLELCATFSLEEDNTLLIGYFGTVSKPCPVSFTNHTYFNLNGQGGDSVANHVISSDFDYFLESDNHCLPTGNILPVDGTLLDFRSPRSLSRLLDFPQPQELARFKGYDHILVNPKYIPNFRRVTVHSPATGICMEVQGTAPAMGIYTANSFGKNPPIGKDGRPCTPHCAICLETQHCPDAPNHPNFPNSIARPGKDFDFEFFTHYKFKVLNKNEIPC